MLDIGVCAEHGRSRVELDARKHRPPRVAAIGCKPLAPLSLHRLRAQHEPPRCFETDHLVDREVTGCIAQQGCPLGDKHFRRTVLAACERKQGAQPVVDPEQAGGSRWWMRGLIGDVVSHFLNLMSSLVRFTA